jgi:hypothetical protein
MLSIYGACLHMLYLESDCCDDLLHIQYAN